MGDGDGLAGAQLDAAVGPVAGAVQHRHVTPRQAGAARQQGGLVGRDRERVVRVPVGQQELGCLGVGVEGVGGHDHAGQVGQVERVQQPGEPRDPPGAPSTARPASTVRVVWSTAASRWSWRPSGGWLAPRRVLPSTATARRPGGDAGHGRTASTDRRGQRLVVEAAQGAADGGLGSRRAPSAERTGWGASAAHPAIAAIQRAPASTAAAASPRTQASGWRQPAGPRWVGDGGQGGQQVRASTRIMGQ